MTASILLIPPVSCRVCSCGSCRHSRCNAAFNWRKFCAESWTFCTRRLSISQACSIRFKLGLMLSFLVGWSSLTCNNKRQLVGCSLGYTPYFSVCKLSFIHRLHEAQTGSRSTNGYYVMSSNSNHVAINTLPTVFVDVDLIAWDVQLLSLTSVLLISNGFSLFLLTYIY
jgi:hypothetical protein